MKKADKLGVLLILEYYNAIWLTEEISWLGYLSR